MGHTVDADFRPGYALRLLLDTHVLLWSLLEPDRIGQKAKGLMKDGQIWLSPITTWECLILADKGRVELAPDGATWIRDALKVTGAREAPLRHEVAILSRSIELAHQDPADRFLAATAAVYDLTLVTADECLLKASGYSVLDCR